MVTKPTGLIQDLIPRWLSMKNAGFAFFLWLVRGQGESSVLTPNPAPGIPFNSLIKWTKVHSQSLAIFPKAGRVEDPCFALLWDRCTEPRPSRDPFWKSQPITTLAPLLTLAEQANFSHQKKSRPLKCRAGHSQHHINSIALVSPPLFQRTSHT